jgi:hypothetical protein
MEKSLRKMIDMTQHVRHSDSGIERACIASDIADETVLPEDRED